jgi:hypothetical protein
MKLRNILFSLVLILLTSLHGIAFISNPGNDFRKMDRIIVSRLGGGSMVKRLIFCPLQFRIYTNDDIYSLRWV